MSDDIGFGKAGLGIVPVGEGANSNGIIQEGFRFGGGKLMRVAALAFRPQEAIIGGWTESQEQCLDALIQLHFSHAL